MWTSLLENKNREIYNQFQYPDIVTVIKVRILEWFGHIVRRDRRKTVKTFLILSFRRVLYVVYFILGKSPAPVYY
jgi:hypothetical protein